MSQPEPDAFFVGYLRTPASLRRFLVWAGGALLLLMLGFATLTAALREAPAANREKYGVSLVGRIEASAYGVLWTLADGADTVQPILLAGGGKFGAPGAVLALDGKVVELTGLLLERDGYRLLEVSKVEPHPHVEPALRARLTTIPRVRRGPVSLRGEIVDIKCWLGRMKPGDGRTHRACAQFCIAGGIPPVLVSHAEDGAERRYVLVTRDGGPINDAVLPYAAEAVELDAELESAGELWFLHVDPAHIRRL